MNPPAASAPPPGARDPDQERGRETLATLLRRAVFRGLLLGAGLTVLALVALAVACVLEGPPPLTRGTLVAFLGVEIGALATGLVATPLAFVEFRAQERPPGLGRDVLAAVLAASFALSGLLLVLLQMVYLVSIFDTWSLENGFAEVQRVGGRILEEPFPILHVFVMGAAPFPALVVARIRKLATSVQIAWTVAGGVVLGTPSFVGLCMERYGPDFRDGSFIALSYAFGFFALALAARGADWLEARAVAWLARRRAASLTS